MKDFKIEVSMTPSYHDNKYKPYWWMIAGYNEHPDNDGAWCNEGFGWQASPELAYKEALESYNRFQSGEAYPKDNSKLTIKQIECLFCHPEFIGHRPFGIGLQIVRIEGRYHVQNMCGDFEEWDLIEYCPKCGRFLVSEEDDRYYDGDTYEEKK